MKIEKVNDNQIRCTLTGEDLRNRNMRISELAYGSDKAKMLFQDLMQQASLQYGFDASDVPIVVEAIPLGTDCIVLVVTKVDDPEELDTRFANFSPAVQNEIADSEENTENATALESLLSIIRGAAAMDAHPEGLKEEAAEAADASSSDTVKNVPGASAENGKIPQSSAAPAKDPNAELQKIRRYAFTHRLLVFDSMSELIEAAGLSAAAFTGRSALYASETEGLYYLVLVFDDIRSVGAMQNVLALLSEYAGQEIMSYAREQYLKEHCRVLLPQDALRELAKAAN